MKAVKFLQLFILVVLVPILQSCPGPVTPTVTPHPNVAGFVATLPAGSYDLDASGFPFKKGEYVVKFTDNAIRNDLKGTISNLQAQLKNFPNVSDVSITKQCECNTYYLVEIQTVLSGDPPPATITSRGSSADGVEIFEPNYLNYQLNESSNANTLPVPNELNYVAVKDYNERAQSSKDIIVGLLDSGVNFTFNVPNPTSDYLGKRPSTGCNDNTKDYLGWNYIDLDNASNTVGNYNIWDIDANRHGTVISNDILQIGFGLGNKFTKILPVKTHKNALGTLFSIACGTRYASNRGVRLVNASWEIINQDENNLLILKDAIYYAKTKNVLFITASGNDRQVLGDGFKVFPAMFRNSTYNTQVLDNIVVVTSYSQSGTTFSIPEYANRGNGYVDIAANADDANKHGTSFACGYITGLGATILYNNPTSNTTYLQLKNSIFAHSKVLRNDSLNQGVNNGKYFKP